MSESNSTASAPQRKPAKPTPDFPLFPHATGRWAKKIKGRLVYFGPWGDPDAALAKYNAEREALETGRNPRASGGPSVFTVGELCNQFLKSRKWKQQSGELSPRTYADYESTTDIMVDHFGKWRAVEDLQPSEFMLLRAKLAKRYGPHRLTNTIQRIRTIVKWAYDNNHIDKPVRFGSDFTRASQKAIRHERNAGGKKLFTAEEIRRLIEAAGPQLKAMLLLGINCAYGNHDCGTLPLSAIDLDGAMVSFPRPKTGIARRCPLWPETVEAIRAALAKRPQPKDPKHAGLAFITKYGHPWATTDSIDSPIAKATKKLLVELHINGRRRLGFYCLRHTFRTVADATEKQTACDYIMGHQDQHIRNAYIEGINDDRLKAVTDHVRAWLLKEDKSSPK